MTRRNLLLRAAAAFGALALGKIPQDALVDAAAPALAFLEGTFIFMDGGTLELGLVRDSVLNNGDYDYQLFAESFESAVRG